MSYKHSINQKNYSFDSLRVLLARATPLRSGDVLAGLSAVTYQERVAAQMCLADVPLRNFLNEAVIPYETDEVTRLIMDTHNKQAFAPVSHFTVGELRDWLLSDEADNQTIVNIRNGLTPEMVAAVSKLMRNQDLILAAQKMSVITRFRNTLGLKGRFSGRLQPNHPTDDIKGIAAGIIDGLLYGCGDAVIGINPAGDSPDITNNLLRMIDHFISQYEIPTQSCVLCHITTTINLIENGAPVDLAFQSIGGTEKTNSSFGVNIRILQEALEAARSLKRGTTGKQVMYFETGQGSSLSPNAHEGVDQQTCEVRSYAVARHFDPLLVNSVVGFIGPEYLYDGRQITRAALEDHFCAKLMGLPMGVDVCYTNHAEADQDDMDNLLLLLAAAGCNFVIGVPGADDIMLNYQSTSFHDILYVRKALNLQPAPEFSDWLLKHSITDEDGKLISVNKNHPLLQRPF